MDKRQAILFLNPPGKKIYIRDYYCSKVSKAYYLPQPVDLLMQTAYFDEDEFDLKVIDGIAEKKDAEKMLSEIKAFAPDLIVGMLGSVSLDEDLRFYNAVKKELPKVRIACSGDALLENHAQKLKKYDWLDAIITNFFIGGVVNWFKGEDALGVAYMQDGGIVNGSDRTASKLPLSIPKQQLFTGKYRMPFANAEPIATVLTNYACPYPCTFCIMSTLPYATRTAESIIAELKYLKASGYRFIYFSDQTFFQSKAITRQILNWMIDVEYGIQWMCFSRVDVLDETELKLMKKAGCRLIMFGVEWAENDKLEHYKKQYTVDQIKHTFALSKSLKIKRLGTFLIGVPGQTEQSILNTVKFAKDIEADYASFNVAVPRSQTSFREEALESGIIDESHEVMDQSGDQVDIGNGVLTREELFRLKSKAYSSFYFRPSYILKRLMGIRSWTEMKMHVVEGTYVLRGVLKKQNSE